MSWHEAQVPCSDCGGGGVAGIVTAEMATDAGDPMLEGQVIPCYTCGGMGWIPDMVWEDDE